MTEFPTGIQELQNLYRFALILSNDPVITEEALDQSVQEALRSAISDPNHAFITLILNLRKRILLKVKPHHTEDDIPLSTADLPPDAASVLSSRSQDELLSAMHHLVEPQRTAYVLWHLDIMDLHDLARLLGLTQDEVSLKLQNARQALLHAFTQQPSGTP
ncbi:MAG: hypothetical protein ABI443_08185 [Chthoniobacterales bacterium]